MAPPRYPNRHVGIYKRATDDSYESVKFFEGKPVNLDHEIVFLFDQSPLDRLAKLGCLWTNINPPLVHEEIGRALLKHAKDDVQLLRASIWAKDGYSEQYCLVNVTNLVHCFDYEKSIISRYFDDGSIQGIGKLRLKNDLCMSGHQLARLAEYNPYILISESLYQHLSQLLYTGLYFELDSYGDPYRF
jgi:hypothetical protein